LALAFVLLGLAFGVGLLPTTLNLLVDPYQVFRSKERPTAINDLAEKSHYPLWKLAKYKQNKFDTIILGDSRARSLRDKYWREAGVPAVLNLAYGGGTIPEIYSTFKLLRTDEKIRRLVIGIQLRSFDENHKGGMNRVPEAVKLLSNHFNYLKNWHVAQTALEVFKAENPGTTEKVYRVIDQFSLSARAADLGKAGRTPLRKLLEPRICFGCDLPEDLGSLPHVRTSLLRSGGYDRGYRNLYLTYDTGNYVHTLPEYYRADLTAFSNSDEEKLPEKIERQVRKNGSADWRNFEESGEYWNYLKTISSWAKERKVELVFVIPPTVVAMQQTITDNGLASNNHMLRTRLSGLGKVVDLDYPNALTIRSKNFTDAYHFNSKVARAIVGQVIRQFKNTRKPKKRNYVFDLLCPIKENGLADHYKFRRTILRQGKNCRIWEIL